MEVGNNLVLKVRVFDEQGNEFIPEDVRIEVAPAQAGTHGGKKSTSRPPRDKEGNGSKRSDDLSPPQPTPVYRNEWKDPKWDEEWTEFCALRAKRAGEGGFDLFLNMDNHFVDQEIKRRKKRIPEEIYLQWESAMTLVAMAVLSQDRRIGISLVTENSDEIRPEIVLQHISRVLAPLIIPLMNDI